jgi:nucleoid-associated protein YgaU
MGFEPPIGTFACSDRNMTGRWKKLAIAGAILIVGIGTALTFRREPSSDGSTAVKAPDTVRPPAASPAAQQKPPSEPALAGRIEPYSLADNSSVSARDTAASFASATLDPAPPADSPLKWQTVRRPEGSVATIEPNRTLIDPITSDRPTTMAASGTEKRHKIVDGDTLPALAMRYLGAEQRSVDLFEYNRDVLTTPDLLPVGKELRIPSRHFVPAEAPPLDSQSGNLTAVAQPLATTKHDAAIARPAVPPTTTAQSLHQTYVVQQHDTLALIARKVYGDISRQGELMAANRQQLRSAKDLRPGMTLVVPTRSQ